MFASYYVSKENMINKQISALRRGWKTDKKRNDGAYRDNRHRDGGWSHMAGLRVPVPCRGWMIDAME